MSDIESWINFKKKCEKINRNKNRKVVFENEESKEFLGKIKEKMKNKSSYFFDEAKEEYDFEVEKDKTLGIDLNTDRKLRRGEFQVDIKLDLHGFTLDESYKKVKNAFDKAYNNYYRHILIITGKGIHSENRGNTIKNSLSQWLKEPFFSSKIIKYVDAPKHLGGDGAVCVLLKRY